MARVGPAGLYLFTALVAGALSLLTLRSLRAVPVAGGVL